MISLNVTLKNLKHFTRYSIGIIACQNFTHDLLKYADEYFIKNEEFNKTSYQSYLNRFPVSNYCSPPNLIVIRTLSKGNFLSLRLSIYSKNLLIKKQ